MEFFCTKYSLIKKKGFSCKNDSLDFGEQSFVDVKYLYFLCSEMYFFWVRF